MPAARKTPPSATSHHHCDTGVGTTNLPSRWSFVWGGALFVFAMTASFAIGWAISIGRGATPDFMSISDYDPLGRLVGVLLGAAIALIGFRLVMRRVEHQSDTALNGRHRVVELLLGLGIGTAIISTAIAAIALLGGYDVSGLHSAPDLLTPLASGIGAGVIEEVFYRGFAFRLLNLWIGSWGALALTSLFFGFSHFTNPGVAWWGSISIAVQAGLLLGTAFLVTQRLWMAIGIHASWNFLQSALFSYTATPDGTGQGLLEAAVGGPTWLTGGDTGIEGSLISTMLCLVAAAILFAIARRRGNIRPLRRLSKQSPLDVLTGDVD
ncbi:lysostaphin resistance A-like protein [Brachybacterium tyrofermentans]|uniref:lysostaphin resistance A-like protein n=1 Tax=Brachybacterium tyrofermentans TaxID=47848 RepID=UPI003FD58EE2